jgi:hypothetical protein
MEPLLWRTDWHSAIREKNKQLIPKTNMNMAMMIVIAAYPFFSMQPTRINAKDRSSFCGWLCLVLMPPKMHCKI